MENIYIRKFHYSVSFSPHYYYFKKISWEVRLSVVVTRQTMEVHKRVVRGLAHLRTVVGMAGGSSGFLGLLLYTYIIYTEKKSKYQLNYSD